MVGFVQACLGHSDRAVAGSNPALPTSFVFCCVCFLCCVGGLFRCFVYRCFFGLMVFGVWFGGEFLGLVLKVFGGVVVLGFVALRVAVGIRIRGWVLARVRECDAHRRRRTGKRVAGSGQSVRGLELAEVFFGFRSSRGGCWRAVFER